MIENNHETAPISSGTIAIQQLAIVQPKLDRSIALRRWVRIYFPQVRRGLLMTCNNHETTVRAFHLNV